MLRERVDAEKIGYLQDYFEDAHPHEILHWAWETFGSYLTVVSSFQVTGIVTLHMLYELGADVPVLTLDTGLLFPETYRLIEEVEHHFDICVQRLQPEHTLDQQAALLGNKLWERDPDFCCDLRKTQPLRKALKNYDAWITGIRRDQSANRAHVPAISYDHRNGLVKLAPFANWTEDMIWAYIHAHELSYNDLHDRGYPSIGCLTCTHPATGDDLRSGRWANSDKTECGIHAQLFDSQKIASA